MELTQYNLLLPHEKALFDHYENNKACLEVMRSSYDLMKGELDIFATDLECKIIK